MRRNIILLAAAGMAGLAAWVWAATFETRPTTADNGTRLVVTGTLNELGSQDVTVRLRAIGTASVTCTNPGGQEPAGQNRSARVPISVSGVQTIPASSISGGRASFEIVTNDPAFTSAKMAGCPGDQWSVKVEDVVFTSVAIRAVQGGRVILRRTMPL